jgi:hypothetical protein
MEQMGEWYSSKAYLKATFQLLHSTSLYKNPRQSLNGSMTNLYVLIFDITHQTSFRMVVVENVMQKKSVVLLSELIIIFNVYSFTQSFFFPNASAKQQLLLMSSNKISV